MTLPYIIKETEDYYPSSVLFDALDIKIEISHTAPAGTVKMWRMDDAVTGLLMAAATLQIRDGVYVLGQLAVTKENQKRGYGEILQNIVFSEAKKMGIAELWGNAKFPEYYYRFGWEKMDWDTSPKISTRCDDCESRGKTCFSEKLRKKL